MSDDFKEKLDLYEKGRLHGEDLAAFEAELEKLEHYQMILEESDDRIAKRFINDEKQKKILKNSKWKARFQTAFVALGCFIMLFIATSVLTAIYYSWGEPDRGDVYANVIDYTLTVTDPYGYLGRTSVNAKTLFRAEMTKDLKKQVGFDYMKVGELKVDFLFSLMGFPERSYDGRQSTNQPLFTLPNSEASQMGEWERLEHLPEGTVVSAYVSFNELMETNEVLNMLKDKDIELIWLAVDSGVENHADGVVFAPIGFPATPIWHDDDMTLDYHEEERGFLFGKIVSKGYSSPEYEVGDNEVLHKQFLKTLQYLEGYESKAEKLYDGSRLKLQERINYINEHGIKHYGIVVTGPTKEMLSLQEENGVDSLQVDEVSFWNWRSE